MITDREFWSWCMERTVASWTDCDRCDLACDRSFYAAVGEGDVEAPLFVLGRAPGPREDKTGRTLWGPGGTVFRQLAKKHGLDLKREVFMTDVVGCRTPRDRPPTLEEREACLGRIKAQFTAVKPTVLLLLGETPLKLCHDVGRRPDLDDWRGKVPREHWPWDLISGWGSVNLKLVYSTEHPERILRERSKRKKRIGLEKLSADLGKIAPIVRLVMRRRAG